MKYLSNNVDNLTMDLKENNFGEFVEILKYLGEGMK